MLSVLNDRIEKTGSYVCGTQMTVVDVLFYCEISTILRLSLGKLDLGNTNPHLNEWFKRMQTVPGMADLDKELVDIV